MDNDFWEDEWNSIKWKKAGIYDSGFKVGGLPDFTKNAKEIEWPHILHSSGRYMPLKFLAQIPVFEKNTAYVYIGTDYNDIELAAKYGDYKNGVSAVIIPGQRVPDWVSMIKIKVSMDLADSDEDGAVTANFNKLPVQPFWISYEKIPEKATSYVGFIPNNPNDTFINDDSGVYIYKDSKENFFAFGQMY